MQFWDTFNTREQALTIWILIALIFMLFRKDIRSSFLSVLKVAFQRTILLVLLTMTAYVVLEILIFYKSGLWKTTLIKDTIFWFLGTALVVVLNINKATQDEEYFKILLRNNLRFALVIQFLLNLFTFSLWAELCLLPILVIVGGVRVVAETKEEYKSVKKIVDFVLGSYGIFLIVFTVVSMVQNYQGLATSDTLLAFILPLLLTFAYLPFLYFLALLIAYENLFRRIDVFVKRDRSLVRYTKWRIFIFCTVNWRKLIKFSKDNNRKITALKNKEDVKALIREFEWRPAVNLKFVILWVFIIAPILVIGVIILNLSYALSWTGFGDFQIPSGELMRGKTLWDWMELVLIPLGLFFGARYFSNAQVRAERERADRNEQASILQNYFDRMQDLILNHNLLDAKAGHPTAIMAMTLTRTTLQRLEPEQKLPLLQFLDGTGLIRPTSSGTLIVSLTSTRLNGVGLPSAYVRGNFVGTDFAVANMIGARFDFTDFSNANLNLVEFRGAKLMGCNFSGANLEGALLKGANLFMSNFSEETIMPNGEKWNPDFPWNKLGVVFEPPYNENEYQEIRRELGYND